jgi:hypothetical protein
MPAPLYLRKKYTLALGAGGVETSAVGRSGSPPAHAAARSARRIGSAFILIV